MHLGQETGQPLLQQLGPEVSSHHRPSQDGPGRLFLDGAKQHRDHLDADDLISLLVVHTDTKHDGNTSEAWRVQRVAHLRHRLAAEVDEEFVSRDVIGDIGNSRIDGFNWPPGDTEHVRIAHHGNGSSLGSRRLTR
jgi:hypothetical protein